MRALGRISAFGLLISIAITVPVSSNSCLDEKQRTQNISLLPVEVSVQRGKEAVICCPLIPLADVILVTWKIFRRGKPSCIISHRPETKETNETCTDRRITWVSTPDQSPHLQIDAMTTDLDGHYLCELATTYGHFESGHDLQVLVPPKVTLSLEKNGTVVCEAATGKPAAQIFWTPDGDCDTKNESDVSDTVTVRSTCHWEVHSVSAVTCLVSHLTGNKSLSTELNQGFTRSSGCLLIILYVKLSLFVTVLLIVGFVFFQKTKIFREPASTESEVWMR